LGAYLEVEVKEWCQGPQKMERIGLYVAAKRCLRFLVFDRELPLEKFPAWAAFGGAKGLNCSMLNVECSMKNALISSLLNDLFSMSGSTDWELLLAISAKPTHMS
jgi:hypothetical protein